jgi:S1-C subfamily serine protease
MKMKLFGPIVVVGLALAVVAAGAFTAAKPASFDQAVEAVRPVTTAGDDKVWCSAVVIRPEVALTARHCIQSDMAVDGNVVAWVETASQETTDIAILHVPGLACPCVAPGKRPNAGDRVIAVGYPSANEGRRTVSEPAAVQHVGPLSAVAPWLAEQYSRAVFIVTEKPIISPGYSGGALLDFQDGSWVVVGVNAIGIPDPSSCVPFMGCSVEVSSGFVPVDFATPWLRRA